jgi:hypothetical protein
VEAFAESLKQQLANVGRKRAQAVHRMRAEAEEIMYFM